MNNYIPDEELQVDSEPDEDDNSTDPIFDIISYPSDLTLGGIEKMYEDGDLRIPDYQRSYVWSIRQASLLIDSFLRNIPVPPLFLFQDSDGEALIIDGQQRVISIINYFKGTFPGSKRAFRLQGLSKTLSWSGKAFSELPEKEQKRLKNQTVLRATNVRIASEPNPKDKSSISFSIFKRLNTGGTPLRSQEIRNALFGGSFNTALVELNKNIEWRTILGSSQPDKHQRDIEMILRVFSLYDALDAYEKPLNKFLNREMEKHLDGESDSVKNFVSVFPKACKDIVENLGDKPFNLRGRINLAALDSVLSVLVKSFGKYDVKKLAISWKHLKDNEQFQNTTLYNTTDRSTVLDRCRLVSEFFLQSKNAENIGEH